MILVTNSFFFFCPLWLGFTGVNSTIYYLCNVPYEAGFIYTEVFVVISHYIFASIKY